MSIEETTYFGRPAYRWGKDGKPHMYRAGDEASRKLALARAEADAPPKKVNPKPAPEPVMIFKKPKTKVKKK